MTKPVRKVKSNGRTITGTFASVKTGKLIQYESHLEYVFIEMLEFDSQVVDIFDQPVKIKYHHKKKNHEHIPDFLVHYKNRKPVIFEVKYQSDVDSDSDGSIARNFNAGKAYAKANNCNYRIITEKEILTIYSGNVDELLKVRSDEPNLIFTSKLISTLRDLTVSTPNMLIRSIASNLDETGILLRQLRILMLKRTISFDIFTTKLNGDTSIKLSRKNGFKELNFPYKYVETYKK